MGPTKVVTREELGSRWFPEVRPGIWKWSDIESKLMGLGGSSLQDAERRIVILQHEDTGDLKGSSPTMFIGVQLIKPGEHVPPHRHNSVALNLCLKGAGYSIVNGERLDWEFGDVFISPPWADHEHFNHTDEDAILWTVQDIPLLAAMRSLMWEEPKGNVMHMLRNMVKKD